MASSEASSDGVSQSLPPVLTSVTAANGLVILSWLVPGLGYFLLRKWTRGALVTICVVAMFALGLALQGSLYSFNTTNLLDILGWVGDLCGGLLYFVTQMLGAGLGNKFAVMGDYGSKFLIAAGLLNILAAADVRDVALGRKR